MGVANCQYCGMALTNTASDRPGSGVASSTTPRMGAPEQSQPELPAWLETLRSGERPNASTTGTPNFSSGELIDEGMLPSWMRPEGSEIVDNSPSGKYPAQRSASMPGPNTDSAFSPTRGMPASSLIDEQSLPPWLQEKQAAAQENIAASSLVEPEVLPGWMKTMQPQSPAPIPPNPIQNAQPPIPPQGIMGNDLIDRQELPPWLSGQNTPASNSEQAGLAASSLLDVNALPSWLREANQEQQRTSAAGFPPPAQPQQVPASRLPNNQAPYNQLPNGQVPARNSNLSAASFIDMDALPDWLRPAEDQRQNEALSAQQRGVADNAGQAPFGAPARPDNMRVPSRPRGEAGPHEESEVAANVFASMLGVASPAPYFPGQQARDASGRPQVPTPPPQSQQNVSQHLLGSGTGYAGAQPMQGNVQGPGGYPMGTMPGGPGMPPQQAMPMNAAGIQPGSAMNYGGSGQSKAKPARRGFLSTILDWFSR
jgi:hypothetical protein